MIETKSGELNLTEPEKLTFIHALNLSNPPDGTYSTLGNLACDVASFAQSFDYILVTGASGIVSAAFLEAAEVPTARTASFDDIENAVVYKSPFSENLSPDERLQIARQQLLDKGIPLERRPSVCVVDESIATGHKARRYTQLFRQLDTFSDFAFAAICSRNFDKRGRGPMSKSKLDNRSDYRNTLYFPFNSDDPNATQLLYRFSTLATLVMNSSYEDYIKPNIRDFGQAILNNRLDLMKKLIQLNTSSHTSQPM